MDISACMGKEYGITQAPLNSWLEARVLTVADVAKAVTLHRPSRASKGIGKATEEIVANRGMRYDDAIAEICLRLIRAQGFTLEDDKTT